MAREHRFLAAEFSERWQESYAKLQIQQKNGTDKVVMAIIKGETTPGMRIKPVEPAKYYDEARCTDADRVIHRIKDGTVLFVDIVPHDQINKYAQKPR